MNIICSVQKYFNFFLTLGGVAAGSVIGTGISRMIWGGSDQQQQQQAPPPQEQQYQQQPQYQPQQQQMYQQQPQQQQMYGQQQQQNVCGFELDQFLACAQNQSDISLCEGFNDALKQCKRSHGLIQ